MTPEDVAAASAAWLWFPDDATVYSTEELLLVGWPPAFGTPPTVLHLAADDEDDVDRLLVDADARARSWGYDALDVRVPLGAPEPLRETLEDLDGTVVETVDVHALDLAPGTPDLDVPADVEMRWQLDEPTTRDHLTVSAAAFGEGELPDEERIRELAVDAALAHREGLGAAAVAYLDGRPVGTGGLTLAEGEAGRFALLWGAGVVPDARGRGGYRAVLAARLQYAVEHDAAFALVKGRVETAAPILRRAGFTAYGQELTYRLSL